MRTVLIRILFLVTLVCWGETIQRIHAQGVAPLRLQVIGLDSGQFRFRVEGENGKQCVIQASEDFSTWLRVDVLTLAGGGAESAQPVELPFQFFRALELVPVSLSPEEATLFPGDGLFLEVDDTFATRWVFTVNGVTNGNASVGRILPSPTNPARFFYAAPSPTLLTQVEVCAWDLEDEARKACGIIHIRQVTTPLEVQPGPVLVGLGRQQVFSAGTTIPGSGFVPFRRVYWKVNGVLGGTAESGTVDFSGKYLAPKVMPTGLPAVIRVGFSLTPEGAVQASVPVTLAELILNPSKLASVQGGPWGKLAATLSKSDGISTALGAADVTFRAGNPAAASVAADGTVIIGDRAGVSVIEAIHNVLGVSDTTVVESRSDMHVRVQDLKLRTDDEINLGRFSSGILPAIREVEVTRPGVMFNLIPQFFPFRGRVNLFTNSMGLAGGASVALVGDGSNVLSYVEGGRTPKVKGIVASIEEQSGFVEVGDKPGTGVVTVKYDDGVIQRQASANVTFTRLKLDASLSGAVTRKTNEVYISEWIQLEVALSNPSGMSSFIGKTPVRVRFANGQKFFIARPSDVVAQGLQVLPLPEEFVETQDITIDVASGYSTLNFPNPELGRLHLRISPREVGDHTLIVSVPNDPGIPERVLPVRILRPELQIKKGTPPTLVRNQPGYGAITGSVVVAQSYVDLTVAVGPSPGALPLYPNRPSSPLFAEDDALVWRIEKPDGTTRVVSAALWDTLPPGTSRNEFSGHFREPGVHVVSLGLTRRSEVRTANLRVEVVNPASDMASFGEIASAARLTLSTNGQVIPAGNQLGGVRILAPTSGAWIPNQPVDVSLQTYSAEGLPKAVGRRVITRSRSSLDPEALTLSTNDVVVGVWCYYVQGPSLTFVDSALQTVDGFVGASAVIPDGNGVISFQMVPQASPEGDMVVVFVPSIFALPPGAVRVPLNLVQETIELLDGQRVGGSHVGVGIADYVSNADDTFLRQALMLPGNGIAINPRFIPVASARVREAVAAGVLPAGAADAQFRVVGGAGLIQALDSGLPTITLGGQGLSVFRQAREASTLIVTLATDPTAFGSGQFGKRSVTLNFPNGQRFKSEIQMVAYSIETLSADHNLPQNAAYGFAIPDPSPGTPRGGRYSNAAVPLSIRPFEFGVPLRLFDLELRSSIRACWDSNQNGVADPGEDRNGDGVLDEQDDASGELFRGVLPVNPLVGFERGTDPVRGMIQVRQWNLQLFPAATPRFYVYGDPTDRRRLDSQTLQLGAVNNPDLLPDFVSRTPNGEMLLVRLGSNLVDVLRFTAYNMVTRAKDVTVNPELSFDQLSSSRDEAYDSYNGLQTDAALGSVLAGNRIKSPVAVYVDHEAKAADFNRDPRYVGDAVPKTFFAGILDQAFQRQAVGFVDFPSYRSLGRDGRVRPYEPVAGRVATGVNKFGVDLDAGLFDAGYFVAPPVPLIIESNLNLKFPLRLDEAPNSQALLGLPVVKKALGGSSTLTGNQLVPALGGSSGGYFSLSRSEPGAFLVESRTPGQAVPGLHAGYLLHDKPSDLTDPDLEYALDDLGDVILQRTGEVGEAAGTGLAPESAKLGNYRVHSVMGFAQNEDKKTPIRTAIRSTRLFKVGTDPESVTPKDLARFKIKPALLVREIPSQSETNFNLMVTSQSAGNEKTMKIVADAAVDLAVDVTSTVILTALTEGAYLKACGSSIGDKVKSAGISLTVGLMESEYGERYGLDQKSAGIQFVNQLVNEGLETGIPGISFEALKDISVSSGLGAEATRLQKFLSPQFKIQQPVKTADICSLVDLPISAFKDWVKSTYSAETFGGLGSAQAVGTRSVSVCIPYSAQLTNGTYSMFTTLSRAVDVLPEEPTSVEVSDLPYQLVFGSYPFADEVSDEEFLQRIQSKLNDPVAGQAALKMLRDVGRKSVWRLAKSGLYQRYKLRAWRMPGVELWMAPGQNLGNGTVIGDFELTPGQTEIPVSVGASAVVSRSNENAGARAVVRVGGHEVILVNGVIMGP